MLTLLFAESQTIALRRVDIGITYREPRENGSGPDSLVRHQLPRVPFKQI